MSSSHEDPEVGWTVPGVTGAANPDAGPGAPAGRPDLGALEELLDAFDAVVDGLVRYDPTELTDAGTELALQRFTSTMWRLPAFRNPLVHEMLVRCLPRTRQHRSPGTYFRELVRVSAAEGNSWARDAELLTERPAVSSGPALPPVLPETAAAVADGAIGGQHVRLLSATMNQVPSWIGPEQRAVGEALLARQARVLDPDALDQACKHYLAHIDPDGPDPDARDRDRARRRDLSIGRQDLTGMTPVRGCLDPETAALLRAALDPLAAPNPTADAPDTRTPGQRQHDALGDLCRRALARDDLPTRHGLPAKVLLTIGLDQLEARTGIVSTAHGGYVTVRDLLRIAVNAGIIPIVFDSDGTVLHLGEETRIASDDQRYALIATDVGCTWPGCTVPGIWCQAAHGEPFRTSKQTTIDDLALLCSFHHHYVDNNGWTIERSGGRVWLTPPVWIDPNQVPRTNEFFRPLRT